MGEVSPTYPEFTGFVFKLQANMDPKHRDLRFAAALRYRIAFVRVCSGKFEKDMVVKHARTGKTIRLSRPQNFERTLSHATAKLNLCFIRLMLKRLASE